MTSRDLQPITFIDSTIQNRTAGGTRLQSIRSHNATLQHWQRQRKLGAWQSQPSLDSTPIAQGSSKVSGSQLGRQYRLSDFNAGFTDGGGQDARCTCRSRKTPLLADLKSMKESSVDEQCAYCHSASAWAVVQAVSPELSLRIHRNDPFDSLPMPTNRQVSINLDYCKPWVCNFGQMLNCV
jgi:hypothetical protein